MCGIFGVTNFKNKDLEKAREALHTLSHRGPDQWNDYSDDMIYIGHRRLSILDLSEHGRQPMIDHSGNIIITVNGEIYNFLELKKELSAIYTFKSTSDSEVILFGYMEWGIDKLLEKIDGMYAISIYDKTKGVIYLVRDRVGIKPLYYSNINNQIAWSSELRALEQFYHQDNLKYDYTAFYDFLTYRYVPTPKSMYQNIYKLEPAYYLEISIGEQNFKKVPYWNLDVTPCNDNLEMAKNNLYQLVKKSINEQMMADVPVGFFLSGGMDSSVVVALAAKEHNNINTFSIGFSNSKHDETHFAEMVARKYKTTHYKEMIAEDMTREFFQDVRKWYNEPFADNSCFPTFLVSEFAKKRSTVVLTGDGGDELFGVYSWYKKFAAAIQKNRIGVRRKILQLLKKQKNAIGKRAKKWERGFLNELELYTSLMGGLLKDEKVSYKKIWNIDDDYDDYWHFRKFYNPELDVYTRLQYLDFHTYLPDDILTKVDRVSMQVSLECRVPFLSKEVVEYSFSLPPHIRLYNNELKGIMKEAFKDILPSEIIERKKKGFSIPLRAWNIVNKQKSSFQEKVLNELFAEQKKQKLV